MNDLHLVVGVILGSFVFIVCFAGALSVFKAELGYWERGGRRIEFSDVTNRIDGLVFNALHSASVDFSKPVQISLPAMDDPIMRIRFYDTNTGRVAQIGLDPSDGATISEDNIRVAKLLKRIHTDLVLPKPWGRYFVGFLGLFLTLSVVTGVLIQTGFLKSLKTLRPLRQTRAFFLDVHRLLGGWALLFHLLVAFTGALLGLNKLLVVLAAVGAFNGDPAGRNEALFGQQPKVSGEVAKMETLDRLVMSAHQ
ncbi:MAG: PepSY-associated TM helix domain-containing protein, partial [Pseudomonadota bacterium]